LLTDPFVVLFFVSGKGFWKAMSYGRDRPASAGKLRDVLDGRIAELIRQQRMLLNFLLFLPLITYSISLPTRKPAVLVPSPATSGSQSTLMVSRFIEHLRSTPGQYGVSI
jgi:hypothetical protein